MSDMAGAMSGNGFAGVLVSLAEDETRPLDSYPVSPQESFRSELTRLINRYSRENASDTPDFLLSEYLLRSLDNFDQVTRERDTWFGRTKNDNWPLHP